MKKILFIICLICSLIPNIVEARHHHHRWHNYGCSNCLVYNGYKEWHKEHGWWLPVGFIAGALITQYQYNQYNSHPIVIHQPSYYIPNNQQYIIIRDTNYPNQVIYETIY